MAVSQALKQVGIYWASQTGTAERFAATLKEEATKKGLEAEVIDLSLILCADDFTKYKYKIMVMATHYEGNSPDNSQKFWAWFSDETKHSSDWLKGFKYTVFALGDKSYANFAKVGRETDRLLEKYGATRVFDLGVGDDEEGHITKFFKEWKKTIWETLVKEFSPEEDAPSNPLLNQPKGLQYSCIISSFSQEKSIAQHRKSADEYLFKVQSYLNSQSLKIASVSELRQNSSASNFTKYIELEGSTEPYKSGGNIAIYPRNSKSKVDRMKALLGFSVNYIFTTKPNKDDKLLPLPSPLGTDNFLTDYIDLSGAVEETDLFKLRDFLSPEDFYM